MRTAYARLRVKKQAQLILQRGQALNPSAKYTPNGRRKFTWVKKLFF
jgi:hypothetical protein